MIPACAIATRLQQSTGCAQGPLPARLLALQDRAHLLANPPNELNELD
jgi:hypothetical protein